MEEITVTQSSNHILEGLEGLFDSGEHSDFIIRCGNCSWNVHKSVICLQSTFFAKACEAPFKEKHSSTITLQEDDPALVGPLIRFMYTGKYIGSDQEDLPGPIFDVRMLMLADKYDVFNLAEQAAKHFELILHAGAWKTPGFADAIAELYPSAPITPGKEMREAAVAFSQRYRKELLLSPEHKYFRDVLRNTPAYSTELAMELAEELAGSLDKMSLFRCPRCDNTVTAVLGPESRKKLWCSMCGHCKALEIGKKGTRSIGDDNVIWGYAWYAMDNRVMQYRGKACEAKIWMHSFALKVHAQVRIVF